MAEDIARFYGRLLEEGLRGAVLLFEPLDSLADFAAGCSRWTSVPRIFQENHLQNPLQQKSPTTSPDWLCKLSVSAVSTLGFWPMCDLPLADCGVSD